jgi:hypothetical protein
MIVLLLWLAALIILVAICTDGIWQTLFWLEMWVISKFGKKEEL